MAHGKETPRQKMIGMMYLVLTALLALNVSKDVLNAFILVDEGLTKTTRNFFQKNEGLYGDFDEAYQFNPTKVQEWKNKADEVKKRSQALYDTIHYYKKRIVITKEGPETPAIHDDIIDLNFVSAKDDNNVPGQIMITEGGGKKLKEDINNYRDYLLGLIEDRETYAAIVHSIESSLDTNDPEQTAETKGEKETWELRNFDNLPLASVIALLSKMQSDVRNAESEMLGFLLSQIDVGAFKFNKIDPVVISNSDYVFRGQEYRAQVFLAAYDSTKFPTVIVNDSELPVENGKGIYKSSSSTVGTKRWGGTIILDQGNGSIIKRDFSKEYQVAEASAVISPTKMNVFYRSVKNPVSISVSGVPQENLEASISKGSIVREGGAWVVNPGPGPEGEVVTVRVSARIEKQLRFMGSMDFRVKNVPNPEAMVANRTQGGITLGDLTKAGGVTAELKNFDFDLDFTVTEFTVSAVLSGGFTQTQTSTNNKFTKTQYDIITQLRPGQRITFENIKAVGPDGASRTLNSIVLKIL
jgi:gliding motility-associated protein GldM